VLIERESSLQSLTSIAQTCREGQGRIVILAGEAGIGKTSLLREFERTAGSGLKVLWGGCEALFTPRPLGPLQDMAKSIDPRIATLLEDGAAQDRIFPALLNALQDSQQAHVLIFEDVHWADNATLDLIKYLGRRVAVLRVMLVLTFRNDEMGKNHPLTHVLGDLPSRSSTRISLQPLSPKAVASLAGPSPDAAANLYAITEGNPFFVTEILASGIGATSKSIPDSIRDAVWSRASRLTAGERELLEVMSILPGGVEPWLLRQLVSDGADQTVESLLQRGMLQRNKQGFVKFRHELARQAMMDGLSEGVQKAQHARVLKALSDNAPDGANLPITRIAHHAAGAGDHLKVLELAPRAATEAAKLGSHREAASHLAMALTYADQAPPELAAQLFESWAYEAGLSLKSDDQIVAAAEKAVDLWRSLDRKDKVAYNLRRLSRLYWYRGDSATAVHYADEAIAVLSGEPESGELAMTYSNRAQLFMFDDRFDEAIALSRKAITLAQKFGEMETRIHALNNLGGSMLFAGRVEGKDYMEESLALAVANGFHEQADRAFANYAEYAVIAKDFPLAERLIAEGIAFDSKHDIDAGIYMQSGRMAQMRMEQGRFTEAEAIASGVMGMEGLALVAKLPALIVLAKTRLRLGKENAPNLVQQALDTALSTQEQQNIVPTRLASIEAAWLAGDLPAAQSELKAMQKLHLEGLDGWDMGSFAVWWQRCAMVEAFPVANPRLAAPRAMELKGSCEGAAEEWTRLGLPYEAALALMHVDGKGASTALAQAVALLEEMAARPAASLARVKAKQLGLEDAMPKIRRGPYAAARSHPLGLTHREVEVLGLVAQGLGNQEIAKKIVRSQKTVEHHVSAVLGKLNAASRMDVVLRLQSEPWLLSSPQN
jgi:DNA-binding CsgD family transcriptional regulator